MRRLFLAAFFCLALLSLAAQGKKSSVCRSGITYDISKSKNWGTKMPVITGVAPYSSAERAGITQSDIITEIEGINTKNLSASEIEILLNPVGKRDIELTLSNFKNPARQVILRKECKPANAISEEQLAAAFCMYSLETTSERRFVCPFKTTSVNDTVQFSSFKTFAFAPEDANNGDLERVINRAIQSELMEKGLEPNGIDPDLRVETFYYFDRNPNYKGQNSVAIKTEKTFRYDFRRNAMVELPFLSPSASESEAAYLLQFGFRLIDCKIQPGRVIWECEANELLKEPFRLEDYARMHVPLMCFQFPYIRFKQNVPFTVIQRAYNYTGLNFNMDKLNEVAAVDANSPAAEAGIVAGDIIERIDEHKLSYSIDEFSAAYRQFITNTFSYRDPKTQYTDVNGFTRCMLWDAFQYPNIADAFQNENNLTAFSYLYAFTPYVNPTGNNSCTLTIVRKKERSEVIIRPTIRKEVTIELK